MTLLIAEQLLLLAYCPDDGTARAKRTELDMGLGGALLTELALDGHVEMSKKVEVGKTGVWASGDLPRPEHPALAAALAEIGVKVRRPAACVTRLSRGARWELLAGMVERGVLTEEPRVFFSGRRFPLADPAPREEALERLRAAVVEGTEPDQRTAALAGLIYAADLAWWVFLDQDDRVVSARLEEIAIHDWVAEAVREAIRAARAATAAASVVARMNSMETSQGPYVGSLLIPEELLRPLDDPW